MAAARRAIAVNVDVFWPANRGQLFRTLTALRDDEALVASLGSLTVERFVTLATNAKFDDELRNNAAAMILSRLHPDVLRAQGLEEPSALLSVALYHAAVREAQGVDHRFALPETMIREYGFELDANALHATEERMEGMIETLEQSGTVRKAAPPGRAIPVDEFRNALQALRERYSSGARTKSAIKTDAEIRSALQATAGDFKAAAQLLAFNT